MRNFLIARGNKSPRDVLTDRNKWTMFRAADHCQKCATLLFFRLGERCRGDRPRDSIPLSFPPLGEALSRTGNLLKQTFPEIHIHPWSPATRSRPRPPASAVSRRDRLHLTFSRHNPDVIFSARTIPRAEEDRLESRSRSFPQLGRAPIHPRASGRGFFKHFGIIMLPRTRKAIRQTRSNLQCACKSFAREAFRNFLRTHARTHGQALSPVAYRV